MQPSKSDSPFLVWIIIASQVVPTFMFSGVAVALPSLGRELAASATSLGLVETLFLAGSVAFLLPIGRIADATDKRTIFKLGMLGFGAAMLAVGVSAWMPFILAARFAQGITSAMFSATGAAILAELVPPAERGKVFGRSIGAVYAGLTLGPVTAGWVVDLWGWRALFVAGALLLFTVVAVVHGLMPSTWRAPERLPHAPSVGLVVASVLGLVAGSAIIDTGAPGWAAIAAGVALAAVFVVVQRTVEHPLVDVRALAENRPLADALLVQMLLYMNAATVAFMLSLYMQVSLGEPAKVSGQILALGTVLMAVLAPVAGALADRHHPRVISSVGVACVVATSAFGTTLGADSSLVAVGALLVVQGLGFALFSSPNMATIMNSVPQERMGLASALGAKSRSLGMVLGMLVPSLLVSLDFGTAPITDDPLRFVSTMTTAFAVLTATTALALFVGVRGLRRR
ncbi:MFS transporter [Myxococcota bacterium]|nr:MFS transporter [Myxococcota bacterium]